MLFERVPVKISDPIYDIISEKVYKSYPNACICFIDRINNSNLQAIYDHSKSGMTEYTEYELFHGTKANLIDTIANNGFDPDKNVVSAYGKGTYFARDARYSSHYMKTPDKIGLSYMFYATILVGEFGKDTLCDNPKSPSIFVATKFEQTYPGYIIAFDKNAK